MESILRFSGLYLGEVFNQLAVVFRVHTALSENERIALEKQCRKEILSGFSVSCDVLAISTDGAFCEMSELLSV